MTTKINYNEIKDMTPEGAYHHINSIEKCLVRDFKMKDLINSGIMEMPVHEFRFVDLSPRGIYMFFDANGQATYIGQTNHSFYQRLPVQLDTWVYKGFGWNSMLRIMGGNRTGKNHDALTEEDHCIDLETVLDYKLLLIEVNPDNEITANRLMWIEKVLLKAYKRYGSALINGKIGGLYDHHWGWTIDRIIKPQQNIPQ
jgi:hypothetical protein